MKELRLNKTPLQQVLGFEVAEEIYDLLPINAQLILDLRIEGYREMDIARVLGIPQPTVHDIFMRTRHALLKSKMHMILESRAYYKETHPIVMDGER